MASLFAILSAPVRMHDGAFAIVVGSAAGIEVKTFTTATAARRHYRILLAGLQMAAEPAFELVVVDGESDYATLRTRIDREYARRAAVEPPQFGSDVPDAVQREAPAQVVTHPAAASARSGAPLIRDRHRP
jgi:hypothetical protein